MRILFCSRRFFPAISGMSIYAVNLLRELVALGHDVTMVSQYRDDAFGRGVYGGGPPPAVPGVKVIGLEARGEASGGDFERDIDEMVDVIVREHEARPFDVLHAQYGYPNGWAVLKASARTGLPNLVSIQGGDGHWVGSCCETHYLAMVRVLEGAGAVLIGGASFVEEVHERLGTPRDRFTIIPGAVDTQRFKPGQGTGSGNPPRLLYHGRVDRRKGVLDFVAALRELDEQEVGYRATISGIGPDVEAARAAAQGLRPLSFTGYADYASVPALYAAHDLFVSPTYAEGFSNTILEAMASGLAVLSCRSVGVTDCVRDGDNGLLIAPGDVAAQAEALRRLIDDPALRRDLATRALDEVARTYSWQVVARGIEDVYRRLLGTAPRPLEEALPFAPCRFRAEPHLL